jgi:hypothetical protein
VLGEGALRVDDGPGAPELRRPRGHPGLKALKPVGAASGTRRLGGAGGTRQWPAGEIALPTQLDVAAADRCQGLVQGVRNAI